MADFGFIDYVRLFWDRGSFDDGNFVPLLCPFWYIRNLLIMSLLSPIIYFIIKYVREIFLLSIAVWWMITFNNAFIPQTILFFSIGAYFSILDINPLKMVTTNKKTFLAFFFLFAVADITMHTGWNTTIGLQVHRMALISNIPVLLFIADICVRKGFSNKLFPASAFFVFAVHYPIVVALRKTCAAKFTNSPDSIHVLLYFACVFVSILLSLSIYKFFDRFLPKAKSILSGNR